APQLQIRLRCPKASGRQLTGAASAALHGCDRTKSYVWRWYAPRGTPHRLFHPGEQTLDVAHRFGQSGDGILCVLLVFKANQALVFDLEKRGENRFGIEDSPATFDRRVPIAECGDVFHVQVVKPLLTSKNRISRVN